LNVVGAQAHSDSIAGHAGARRVVQHVEINTLYVRNWNSKQVLALDELPVSEENAKKEEKESNKVNAFKMPIAQLEMYVDKFIPGSTPGKIEEALPFNKQKAPTQKRPAAHLKLTVDGKSEEFWLAGMPVEPFDRPPLEGEHRVVSGDKRNIAITMPARDIFEQVGFQVRLKRFERKL